VTLTRRTFLTTVAGSAAYLIAPRSAHADQTTKRPNILFFLIDDQRNDSLGCAGHPQLQTPIIDRLAAEGVRFRNAFVTTSICAASRATLLTGLYERTHGFTFGTPPIRKKYVSESYPAVMRNAGYRTGFIGKFGVKIEGDPQETMFDFFKPIGRNPYFKKQPDGSLRHETELAGDRAIEFLQDNPKDNPFCLSISFNAVHAEDGDKENHYPWPKAVDGMYDNVEMLPPRLSDPAIFEAHPEFLKKSMNRDRYFWRWDTPEKYEKNLRAYFRMISGVDRVIGRVRQALEEQGFADNTVIVYMADNGYYMGNRGFAGKWTHYEESLRVPLIVYDPHAPKPHRGTTEDAIALNVDVPATILELAGIDVPKAYQGHSLAPFLRRGSFAKWRHDFFCEHLMEHKDIPKWEGIRDEQYVYARYFEQEPPYEFLHDLKNDPDQRTNFVDNSDYADILAKLRNRCNVLRDEYAKAATIP